MIYAYYDGELFIDVGTLQEIAIRQQLSLGTLYKYKTPAHKRRYPYGKVVIELGGKE